MKLNIADYTYELPANRIALFPLAQRDHSKLLVYQADNISHQKFPDLVNFLPSNTLLYFNNTKVIPARLHFQKDTGATIELFLLNPIAPSILLVEAMQAHSSCTWKCTIGNLKRWSSDSILKRELSPGIILEASLLNKEECIVEFKWSGSLSFAEILQRSGEIPLPPYLKRSAEESDKDRYQTIYSTYEGAVAAPTAGLHFTDAVFESLRAKGITHDFVTLHVSAGTFQPVKVADALDHTMHSEQIVITRENVINLLQPGKFIVPVGTTSMRTLESLYWFGVKLLNNSESDLIIDQHYAYQKHENLPTKEESLHTVLRYMDTHRYNSITGHSSIFIHPGYKFKMCQALVTNFHQPSSTLILLVAAFIGDAWRQVYNAALENEYRFLSYGDSSLLMP
jgi:S-adenosylmethionine:tRNA ribosyltransferase-isomerase